MTDWADEEIWAPMEELTDDVMAFICEHGIAAGRYVGFGRGDAKELITRISKAYTDGLEILGEVGRKVVDQGDELAIEGLRVGDTLIAFREEEQPNDQEA